MKIIENSHKILSLMTFKTGLKGPILTILLMILMIRPYFRYRQSWLQNNIVKIRDTVKMVSEHFDRCREEILISILIFTASKRSWRNVMFLHLSVILFTGGLCSQEGSLCRWGSLSRGYLSGGLCDGNPTIQWNSGQYTSYWNAFLYNFSVQTLSPSFI